MTNHKGLILFVYRAADGRDCTLGGASGKHDTLTLVGFKRTSDEKWLPLEKDSQVFEPTDHSPAVILVESRAPGFYGPHLVPLDVIESGKHSMHGGNYAGTSDSRWSRLGRAFFHDRLDVVSVHDRVE